MFLDNLDEETKLEHFHDWYIIFKEQKPYHQTVKEFVDENFNLIEVNENTHDYWKK